MKNNISNGNNGQNNSNGVRSREAYNMLIKETLKILTECNKSIYKQGVSKKKLRSPVPHRANELTSAVTGKIQS
jgi:hypothetical protein